MRRQIEVANEVAAALSGSNDQILRALEGHVDCKLFLRGNVITLDGEAEAVAAAAVVVRELSELIEQGHEIAEGTIAAVTDALVSLPADGVLIVATHGAAGRALAASLIGLPTTSWRALGSLANCSWSIVRETERGWRLAEHNAGTLPEPVVGDDQ